MTSINGRDLEDDDHNITMIYQEGKHPRTISRIMDLPIAVVKDSIRRACITCNGTGEVLDGGDAEECFIAPCDDCT